MIVFHPHVSSSFASFLGFIFVVVFVSGCVMAVIAVMVPVTVFFDPHVTRCYASFLGFVLSVVFVSSCIMANSVLVTVLVTVFVTVFVTVVTVVAMVTVAAATFFCNMLNVVSC